MEFGTMMGLLLSGLQFTAIIFVVTLVGALPLGVLVALGRMSKFKPLSLLVQFYISVMRGTPLMLQLMMWMFGPYYIFGISMGPDWKYGACCIGFILNYAAYFGEIYRSGIQSIPRGQYEAAEVLGYSRTQTFMKIDPAAGVQAHPSRHGQRDYHVGEGHVVGVRAGHHGDVHAGEGHRRSSDKHDAVRHRRAHLLGVQLRGGDGA